LGAALALTGLVRAVGLSGIEGTFGLRGMVWIQMPLLCRAQDGSAATAQSRALLGRRMGQGVDFLSGDVSPNRVQ
jgi:hypothetical protein